MKMMTQPGIIMRFGFKLKTQIYLMLRDRIGENLRTSDGGLQQKISYALQ